MITTRTARSNRTIRTLLFAVAALGALLVSQVRPAATHADGFAAGPAPDLRITSVSMSFVAGGVKTTFTVKNAGTAAAGASHIRVTNGYGGVLDTIADPGLAVGQSRTYVSMSSYPQYCQEHWKRTVIADAWGEVAELNEANNSASVTKVTTAC
jgi:hypothetical protein